MIKLLCISGKRESGKSLLASYLEHYYGWEKWSLADELKRECMRDWKLNVTQLWGKEKESPTPYKRMDGSYYTPRDIMIRHGIYRRSIDPLYWCKQFNPHIADKVVIDDVRFLNEIEYFKKNYQAKFVRLNRTEQAIGKAALDDLSETELDVYKDWDWVLLPEKNVVAEDLKQYAEYLNAHFL